MNKEVTLNQWLRRHKACARARYRYAGLDPQQAWQLASLDDRMWALARGWPWATPDQRDATLDQAVQQWLARAEDLMPARAYYGVTWYWAIPVGSPIARDLHNRWAVCMPHADPEAILSNFGPRTQELTRDYLDRNGSNDPIAISTFLSRRIRGSARKWLSKYRAQVLDAILDLSAAACVAAFETRRRATAWVWQEDIR